MKILGIDPGLARMGWGVISIPDPAPSSNTADLAPQSCAFGFVATAAGDPLPSRLKLIHDTLRDVIAEHRPTAAAVEEIFFAANVKTAVAMAQARGAAILALADGNVEFFEYSPLQIKQSVAGYGRAEKSQVQLMVRNLLGLKTTPKPDHAADALAAALCHAASLKRRAIVIANDEAKDNGSAKTAPAKARLVQLIEESRHKSSRATMRFNTIQRRKA